MANSDLFTIPGKGQLYLPEYKIIHSAESFETDDILGSVNSGHIPFEISQEKYNIIIETIETKKRLEGLTEKFDAIFSLPEEKDLTSSVIDFVKNGDYLAAYQIMNDNRVSHLRMDEKLLGDFYCGLREIDPDKAMGLVLRAGKFASGFDDELYERLDLAYFKRLERNGRIIKEPTPQQA
jgi:hypothetical protein